MLGPLITVLLISGSRPDFRSHSTEVAVMILDPLAVTSISAEVAEWHTQHA